MPCSIPCFYLNWPRPVFLLCALSLWIVHLLVSLLQFKLIFLIEGKLQTVPSPYGDDDVCFVHCSYLASVSSVRKTFFVTTFLSESFSWRFSLSISVCLSVSLSLYLLPTTLKTSPWKTKTNSKKRFNQELASFFVKISNSELTYTSLLSDILGRAVPIRGTECITKLILI